MRASRGRRERDMDLKRLRQRCEARLRELELPVPFNLHAFCDALGARRGRPIRLCPATSLAGPCGLWAAGTTDDYIFYEQATSPLHQEHIVLHEASHMLCGHRPARVSDDEASRLLFPDLDAAMVKRVLGRAAYSAVEEQEAELLASLILERAGRTGLAPARAADPEVAALVDRLEAALEKPAGGSHD
jgi:hypothetical protein